MKKNLNGWFSRNRVEILLFVVLLAGFVYVFPRWADPNQNSRLDMVVAVVDDGTFQIDPYVENTVDYAFYDGHYYSDKPPGAAFLGIPIYYGVRGVLNTAWVNDLVTRLGSSPSFQSTLNPEGSGVNEMKVRFAIVQIILAFLLAALPSALTGVLLYRLGLGFGWKPAVAVLSALVYGFASPAFPYANAFYGHQLSAFLLVWAFYLTLRLRTPSPRKVILIGALLSYSVISEYPTFLAVAVIGLLLLYRLVRMREGWQILWILIPGLAGVALLLTYNQAVFGSPFSLGYQYSENWTEQHSTGFMSLTAPRWEALWGISFGLFRGMFPLAPVLLLSIPGLVLWMRSRRAFEAAIAALALFTLMFLFNASSAMWWGGFSVGPRYLLAAMPFLILAVGFALEYAWRRTLTRILAVLFVLVSVIAVWGMSLAGQAFPPDTIANPWTGYLAPNWAAGNIARNLGTLLKLQGVLSLMPLVLGLALGSFWLFFASRRSPHEVENEPID